MAAAVLLAGSGEPESAAGRLDAALAAAPEGGGGWILPVEPLLAVNRDAERWAPVLARAALPRRLTIQHSSANPKDLERRGSASCAWRSPCACP